MADTIEDSIKASQTRLLDDLLAHEPKFYFNNASNHLKESLIKEGVVKKLKVFIEALNLEFKDVHFKFSWGVRSDLNQEMKPFLYDAYDKDFMEENYGFDDVYDKDDHSDYFYRTPIGEIDFRLDYFWERKCSLGCMHKTNRFYITNMPKLMDILAWYKSGMPIRTLVKEFIPDFFYDPTVIPVKRGRPRKH